MRLLLTRSSPSQSMGKHVHPPAHGGGHDACRSAQPPLAPHPKRKFSPTGHNRGLPTAPTSHLLNERLWRQCSQLVGEGNQHQLLDCHRAPAAASFSRWQIKALAAGSPWSSSRGMGQEKRPPWAPARTQGRRRSRQSRRFAPGAEHQKLRAPGPWAVARPGGIGRGIQRASGPCGTIF